MSSEETYAILNIQDFERTQILDLVEKHSLIGLENNHPYLKLGNLFFHGQVDDTVGTQLIFEKTESGLEYVGKTTKNVNMVKFTLPRKIEVTDSTNQTVPQPVPSTTETIEMPTTEIISLEDPNFVQ
jgi:hypothetical protein